MSDGRDRSLLTDLVYGTLRNQILLDASLEARLEAPERLPEATRAALRLAAYELLIRGTPPHAAVDEWVTVVKRSSNGRMAGLANAVLRRLELPDTAPWYLRCSLPEWLAERLLTLLREEAEEAAAGMLEPEPLWLSLFAQEASTRLAEEGCEVRTGPVPGSLAVRCPVALGRLDAFRNGLVQPQNPASRLPVLALGEVGSERVLDLASGHGIKSAQLATAGAQVVCVEVDARKVERARQNLARLHLSAEHVVADLRHDIDLAPARKVLLDAPCSGTGTLRGNPEIKLRLTPEDVDELVRLQSTMLDRAADLTAPGGSLVYSVCALTPEEGPRQVESFLRRRPDFQAVVPELPIEVSSAGAGVVVVPRDGLDGFFIARLERTLS